MFKYQTDSALTHRAEQDENTVKGKILKVVQMLQLFRYLIFVWNLVMLVMMLW